MIKNRKHIRLKSFVCSQLAIEKKMDTTKAFLTKSSSSYRRRTKYIEWDHCSSKIKPYWNWKESTLWCKPHTNILAPNNTRFHFIDDKLADSRKSISSSSNCTSSSNNNNRIEGEVVVSKLPVGFKTTGYACNLPISSNSNGTSSPCKTKVKGEVVSTRPIRCLL